jgi:deleted-in-malignant-brain-tumors protein 1
MDDVQCVGNETLLVNCVFNPNHNCIHFEDASVRCAAAQCNETDVRLVGGTNVTEGRVEICLGGQWGTICDDFWGVSEARVVCRQLGYSWRGAVAYSFAQFGQGSGPIALDNLQCSGDEDSLLDCPYDPDTSDCSHFEDAGLMCAPGPNECTHGQLRLVGGSNVNEGRVEVCLYGGWGTVCDDLWGVNDAAVVCRQLGINGSSTVNNNFAAGTGIINLDNVGCTGSEQFLVNCTYTADHNCVHAEDAGVTCGIQAQCNDTDIRLVGGSNDNEGRVEVCVGGQWGTVCDDFFDYRDAQVFCKQLGLPYTGAVAYGSAFFGRGSGPIHLDDVQCTGSENSVFNCTYNPNHNCVHFEDAGVMCQSASCNSTDVRLVNGLSDSEGRVEVCLNGAWGTVCDDFWSTNDAVVVCRQLGYS